MQVAREVKNFYDSVYNKAETESLTSEDTKAAAVVLRAFHETVGSYTRALVTCSRGDKYGCNRSLVEATCRNQMSRFLWFSHQSLSQGNVKIHRIDKTLWWRCFDLHIELTMTQSCSIRRRAAFLFRSHMLSHPRTALQTAGWRCFQRAHLLQLLQ